MPPHADMPGEAVPPRRAERAGPQPRPSLDDPETSDGDAGETVLLHDYPPPPDDDATPFIHSGWATNRGKLRAALVRTNQSPSRVQRFDYCGRDASIYVQYDGGKMVDAQVRGSCCRDRMCLVCGRKRSQRWAGVVRTVFQPKKPPLFITLTLGGNSNEPLAEKLNRLISGFRALRQTPIWKQKVFGGIAFLEVKRTRERWHPHLHILADGRYIESGWLSQVWHAITGDSFIVDVRRVQNLRECLNYVSKYASKPIDRSLFTSEDLLCEAILALKGRRLIVSFGKFYGEKLTLSEAEEFDETEILTTWRCYGRVDSVVAAARAGSEEAVFILAALERSTRDRSRDPTVHPF